MKTTIQVQNLKKYFGKVKAVDDISFEVNEGEIFGFLGPNGAGKTTTIRCIMDFLRPDTGLIEVLNKDAQKYSQKLKEKIGFLSGEFSPYKNWTGQDHMNLLKKIRKVKTCEKELMKKLEFDPTKKVKNLSSGNKQKLGLILALMHKPQILILDEPTLGLDPLLQNTIYEILKKEVKNGKTVFMSSHNMAEVERICDRVCIIKQGKIVAIEDIGSLKKKRLYTVRVLFKETVSRKDLETNGIKVSDVLLDGFILQVKGDITELINKLNDYQLKDIEISHSNLEDMFLEYYK